MRFGDVAGRQWRYTLGFAHPPLLARQPGKGLAHSPIETNRVKIHRSLLCYVLPMLMVPGLWLMPLAVRAQDAPATAPVNAPTVADAPQPAPAPQIVAAPAPVFTVATAKTAALATLGSDDKTTGFKAQVKLTYWGAGVANITLADYTTSAMSDEPYVALHELKLKGGGAVYPLAARTVSINGSLPVDLQAVKWNLETITDIDTPADADKAVYSVTLLDAAGQPALRIARTFTLAKDNYNLQTCQTLTNLTDQPLKVVWAQNAQGDAPNDDTAYMGDRREFIAGYYDLDYDPQRQFIYTKGTTKARAGVIDSYGPEGKPWLSTGLPAKHEIVWLASVNRYFALAVHEPVNVAQAAATLAPATSATPTTATPPAAVPPHVAPLDATFPTIGLQSFNEGADRVAVLTLTTATIDLAPQASRDIELSLFAGPRDPALFAVPPYSALAFDNLVVYNLGGFCAFCTFQWLAKGMMFFLKGIHFITWDWGISIIILVILVRGALHPITRRSQINMAKMQKGMAGLQPELEKLKKKYGKDSQQLQAETMKLYREKGVNPLNMLGCLPMFLQMPIWFALYAMLYYAIELRHEPAFYGIFQAISGGSWSFLADLSSADHFIRFSGEGVTIPLYFINPQLAGINVIPILMAVVFYYQQKMMAPTTPPANDQAAQQQKMMKWMTLLFPIFLYSAPSGLTLYILASTGAGILDSYLVRKHIKREEEAGTLFKPVERKNGGLMDRIGKMVEQKQAMLQDGNTDFKKRKR